MLSRHSFNRSFSRRLLLWFLVITIALPSLSSRHLGLFALYLGITPTRCLALDKAHTCGHRRTPVIMSVRCRRACHHSHRAPRRRMPRCRTPRCTSIRTPAHRTPCCTSIRTHMPAHSRMHDCRRMQRDPNHRCMQCDSNLASMTTETPTEGATQSSRARSPRRGSLTGTSHCQRGLLLKLRHPL